MGGTTRHIIHALIWSLSGTLGNQAAQFVITLFLARLLSPADFGVVALLTIFLAVTSLLVESGFGPALIQKQDATHVDESSVFYFNLTVAVCLYGVLWWAADPISQFYREPMLTPLTRWLALVVVFNAGRSIQINLLTKQLDFKTIGRANILSTVLSGIVGIGMALKGYGVWSLVGQSLTNSSTYTLLLWMMSAWRPCRVFSPRAIRTLVPYGFGLLASGLLTTIFDNLLLLLIGKLYSKTDLGYYTRAQITQRFVSVTFASVTGAVVFPVYAAVQHDRAQLRDGYRKTIIVASLAMFPVMLGLAVMAHPLFLFVYSATWLPSVPYFIPLCISGAIFHLHAFNLNVLKATGETRNFLRLEIIKKVMVLVGFILTYRYGILSMVYGQVVISFLSLFVNTYYTGKLINYTFWHQCLDVWPFLTLSLAMSAVMFAVGQYLPVMPVVLHLAVMLIVGMGVYGGYAWLTNLRGTRDIVRQILRQCASGVNRPSLAPAPPPPVE